MYERALFAVWLLTLVLLQNAESCVLRPVVAQVPKRLPAGYVISEAKEELTLKGCAAKPVTFTSSDPDFAVNKHGTISTVRDLVITTKRLSVLVRDEKDLVWRVDIILSSKDKASQKSSGVAHKRTKRRWAPLPFSVIENDTPPFPKDLEAIASDSSVNYTVYYEISGQGVTTDPVNLFQLNKDTGMLSVTRAVDREKYPQFKFIARVFEKGTGREVDAYLPITVIVEDKNDNAPEFTGGRIFTVEERCRAGTFIGKVNATDKDQEKTPHTSIKFSLLNATDMFSIEAMTGVLTAKTNTLDREAQDKVYVGIEIRDMGGGPSGLFNRGTIVIDLTDVNDNPPTFKEKLYKATAPENKENVLVTRIPVEDKDLVNTPNWKALFEVTKGNESGQFRMETDPETNEGLLYVVKTLDFEKTPVVKLEITARNEVPLVGTSASWLSVPLEISVGDEDEGPEFNPNILYLKVKENVPNGTVIGTYKALDPENKNSDGIKYYKLTDPGNWITVVENTGELKTANTIDRESPLVQKDMYNITIRAVDASKKQGRGMVILQIEDDNDNMPVIPGELIMCSRGDMLSSVLVEAVDLDKPPFSIPFTFKFGAEHDGSWKLKDNTDTSVVLEQAAAMPNGLYSVPLLVTDLQGFGKEQTVNVRVCACEREDNGAGICGARSASASLGSLGILALVLSSLLLLLLCLLLIFICSTKRDKLYISDDTGTGGMLLKSNTEAPGEEVKDGALLMIPGGDVVDGSLQSGVMMVDSKNVSSAPGHIGQQFFQGGSVYNTTTQDFGTEKFYSSGRYDNNMYGNTMFQKFSNMGALDTWKTNGRYLEKKLAYFGGEEEGRYADDLLKTYGHEGVGSPAGSVGCCSILGDQESLEFLNTLGPKFRPLADVCYTTKKSGN